MLTSDHILVEDNIIYIMFNNEYTDYSSKKYDEFVYQFLHAYNLISI